MRVSQILINGKVSDGTVPITDSSVLRGDGCFEVLKSYDGVPFQLGGHLDRLERSAMRMGLSLPERDQIAGWVVQTSSELGNCAVRIVVTRGSSVAGIDGDPIVAVFAHDWRADPGPVRLLPVVAPWHSAGVDWDLAGAKVLSYAPNLSATRRAKAEGFDDALMLTVGETILEGPTFSIGWIVDGVLETPTLETGILDSITRRVVLELARSTGLTVVEGVWTVARLSDASEVMALSTIKEVQSVSHVGSREFEVGPVAGRLQLTYQGLVRNS